MHIHSGGLVHNDLQLSNMLLRGEGERYPVAKVVDFGLIR